MAYPKGVAKVGGTVGTRDRRTMRAPYRRRRGPTPTLSLPSSSTLLTPCALPPRFSAVLSPPSRPLLSAAPDADPFGRNKTASTRVVALNPLPSALSPPSPLAYIRANIARIRSCVISRTNDGNKEPHFETAFCRDARSSPVPSRPSHPSEIYLRKRQRICVEYLSPSRFVRPEYAVIAHSMRRKRKGTGKKKYYRSPSFEYTLALARVLPQSGAP